MKSPSLRIAYLVSMYPAVSHTFILREVLALRDRGIEIEVASVNSSSSTHSLTQVEQHEATNTFYIKQAGSLTAFRAVGSMLVHRPLGLFRGLLAALNLGKLDLSRSMLCLFYYAEAAILARWMHQQSLKHLHVHFATPAATVGLILTHMAPITMSMTVHGPDEFYDVPGYYLAEKIAASRFIVCISFFAQSQLMKLTAGQDWGKFDLARLGVDSTHFAPRPFRVSPEILQILCVGRLVATKGQRILIYAIEQLVQAGRQLCLTFIGDGPDRDKLESLVDEKNLSKYIRFEGSINQNRIQEYYLAADIFALASFAEGIPVVLMEAMAMEIPCIATHINGIPELIRNGVDGLLVAPSDIDGMATALARLMDDSSLRRSLGKAGRQRVLEDYELSRSTDRLAHIFQSRLGQMQ